MKKMNLFKVLFLFALFVNAQEITISGNVTDHEKLPLPGVNVIVNGKAEGTQTDFDGNYTLKTEVGDSLVFSYIGYITKTIVIANSKMINVQLEEDEQVLEEVIVIGYGTQRKSSITGSVVRIRGNSSIAYRKPTKREKLKNNIAQQLQGKISGVQIVNSAASPSVTKEINTKPSNNSYEPMYIIDGVVQTGGEKSLNKIKASKINTTEVFKGVKARALFGESAKNGCVVITTKNYKNSINYDEEYARLSENKFKKTQLNPLSTFSIDVDKAGYSNIRRMINNGETIPVEAVRVEEMVNYFNYKYPQPKGEHPFSINTEVGKTPWNLDTKIVRIGLQGKQYINEELPASNLTFLIDVSGSMDASNKLPLLKSAFKLFTNQLREKDKVSIIVYAGATGMVLPPTNGDKKEKILAALNNLSAGGSTAGGKGIKLAYKLALKNFKKNGNNRVILATDGDFNVGASNNKAMENLIEEKRKSGIFLSVLGFGMGNYKDSKLELLANKGNGNYAYIDNMQEAQKVFGDEFGGTLHTIAKDVKIQVEFNPTKVQAYRLIGYENRLLADEDFVDDTIDAGELGSGHKVTALYEIVPVGVQTEYIKEVPSLKYVDTANTTNFSEELFTVKFRYKKPNENTSIEMIHTQLDVLDDLSTDFNFASAVALFGLQLRKSQFTNGAKTKQILELAEKGRGADKMGYRAEFIRMVKSHQNM
ncbi:von Willebrand factor type A domain-containing protein [uncultured Maribacter sp.]|uniref:YfbK domain-containing protein n=1 Tax=uncultured Maribacter sp. TaxID=431308 RepID=UPI0026399000|nr:von Willebrand factor type A domain-containing protein [uncultured Maribacter sp.]